MLDSPDTLTLNGPEERFDDPPRREGSPPDHEQGITTGQKCLALAMISGVNSPDLGDGRAVAVAAHSHKTAEEEYEEQVRILIRIVSSSTLGLLAFAAGLLIGTFLIW